ncbi:MAG: hypothetical protein ACI3XZ_10110, partial [Butyricicoccus sp.]
EDGAEQGSCSQGYADLRRLIYPNIPNVPRGNGGHFFRLFYLFTEKANSRVVFCANFSVFTKVFSRTSQ